LISNFGSFTWSYLKSIRLLGWYNLELANIVTECKESKACAPAKHHFDECVERVTSADHGKPVDKKHPDEDCVEECQSRKSPYLGSMLTPHSLPSRSLRKHLRRTKAMECSKVEVSATPTDNFASEMFA
jgi:hypothetical protein